MAEHNGIDRKLRLTRALRAAVYNDIVRVQEEHEKVAERYGLPVGAIQNIVRNYGKDLLRATQEEDTIQRQQQFDVLKSIANKALGEFERSKTAATTIRVTRKWGRLDDPSLVKEVPYVIETDGEVDDTIRNTVQIALDSTKPSDPFLVIVEQQESVEISNRPGDPRFISTALSAIESQNKLLGLNRPPKDDSSVTGDHAKIYDGFDPDNPDLTPREVSSVHIDEEEVEGEFEIDDDAEVDYEDDEEND